jgi:hypothetical protein
MNTTKRTIAAVVSTAIIVAIIMVAFLLKNEHLFADPSVYSGKEDHSITLSDAGKLTAKFRNEMPPSSVYAQYIGKGAIQRTLDQKNCVGLRIYYGKHEDGSPTLVFVGVDKNGADLVDGPIDQKTYPCPPFCSPLNVLSSTQLTVK